MSESAFGIEHGHVEKAFKMPKLGGAKPKPPKMSGTFQASQKGAQKTKAGFQAIGQKTGQGFSGVGNALQKRPGITGTGIVLGGGGTALTGGIYANRKQKPGQSQRP